MQQTHSVAANIQLEHQIFKPTQRRYNIPILLLHGAWHGAWCWQSAANDLAARGFETHIMSLRGHGKSSKATWLECSLDAYLSDLHRIVSQIDIPPIVVGHSLGGFVLQHYLEQHPLAGAVLLCALPATHFPSSMLRTFANKPKALLRTLLTGDSREYFKDAASVRAAFFRPDCDPRLVETTIAKLDPEPIPLVLEPVFRRIQAHQQHTPVAVIAAQADALFSLADQQRLAAWYNTQLHIIPQAAHNLMLDPAWPQAAELIEQYATEWRNLSLSHTPIPVY